MIETEVKISLDDKTFEELYERLLRPPFHIQRNLIYKLGSSFFRLRQESDKTILTIKGPRQNGILNNREEIESELTANIFDEFRNIIPDAFYYEKQRAYRKESSRIICFDILSNGKKYVEIEADECIILDSLKQFKLENYLFEKRSYQEILMNTSSLLELTRYHDCPRGLDLEPGSINCMKCLDFIERRYKDFGSEGGYVTKCKFSS